MLALATKADRTKQLGRRFVDALADETLTEDETAELLEDIDGVLATWNAARGAVKQPLAMLRSSRGGSGHDPVPLLGERHV